MILVPAGTFEMGDTDYVGEKDEYPVRTVSVPAFYISVYELTFTEYDIFCKETWGNLPEDYGWGRELRPVINVSWYDAIAYCNWRSKKEGLEPCYTIDRTKKDVQNLNILDDQRWVVSCNFKANGYRLPTEAEWEYAARGAGNALQRNRANVDTIGWFIGNAITKTRAVGNKRPNSIGIYDMSGNVWEWCWDWYAATYVGLETNHPKGPDSGIMRIARGGSWEDAPQELRVANRQGFTPSLRNYRNIGFRLVRTAQ